jgi:PD-(D/E)XK endonuclease
MSNPKEVGEKTEAAILNHLTQKGIPVSIPWGNNQRYDLIVEEDGKLLKAQCKTGTYKKGVVSFPTSSKSGGKNRKDYVGQIDCFLVSCKELNKFYRVWIADAPKNSMTLRIDPLKKFGPKTTIKWAKDYEI